MAGACLTLLGDIAPVDRKVDVRIAKGVFLANLEAPFIGPACGLVKAPKAGPHLAHRYLVALPGTTHLVLANNHVMDYGEEGLLLTQRYLAERNITYCGAGGDHARACAPLVITVGDVEIGVISCCEKQFGVAGIHRPGVCHVGPWIYGAIRALKSEVHHVIVSIHGAAEMSPWPAPTWQKLLRSFIDAGVSIVHGHHSHVPQGYEQYRGGHIFYGLGNFIADPASWRDYQNTLWSIGVKVSIEAGRLTVAVNTFVIENEGEGCVSVRPATKNESSKHADYLTACNNPLGNELILEALWQEVAFRIYEKYYAGWMGWRESPLKVKQIISPSCGIKMVLVLLRDIARGYKWRQLDMSENAALRYHLVACESHQAVLSTVLSVICCDVPDLRSEETRRIVNSLDL